MPMIRVSEDQFEVSDYEIKHTPTGYTFMPSPGDPHSGSTREGDLGNVLENGDDYWPDDVKAMMRQLWMRHIEKKNA